MRCAGRKTMPLTSKEFGLPARQGSAHNLRVGSIMNLHSARHNWAGLQRTNNDVLAQRMKLFLRSLGGTNEKICAVSLAICVLCWVAIFPCTGHHGHPKFEFLFIGEPGASARSAWCRRQNFFELCSQRRR